MVVDGGERFEALASEGGPRAKRTPYGTGRRFGTEELEELREALEQETLFYHGPAAKKTAALRERFAALHGVSAAAATSSGSAAIHAALGALGVSAGDEVITTPITDMGTVIGVLYQQAVPVFADLHPHTYNLDPASVEARITPRTRGIIAVHLAGNPCDMDALLAVARRHNLWIVEDCAQSFLARSRGRLVGTLGDLGCFSLNDFKHISAGEGGLVIGRDSELVRRAQAFADKNYHRDGSGRDPSFLAPNYRITELQSAVALAQLRKLPDICARRQVLGDAITDQISGVPGIAPHRVATGDTCTYWFYMFRVDPGQLGVDRNEFARLLAAEGVSAGAGYIARPIYEYDVFARHQALRGTSRPFAAEGGSLGRMYGRGLCPVAEEILATAVRLPVSEFHSETDVVETGAAIRKVVNHLLARRRKSA